MLALLSHPFSWNTDGTLAPRSRHRVHFCQPSSDLFLPLLMALPTPLASRPFSAPPETLSPRHSSARPTTTTHDTGSSGTTSVTSF